MALTPTMKSYAAKPGEIEPNWLIVDATDKVLGRLASRVATILMGKHRPTFTPGVETGDFVVVINAEKVRVTGKKRTQETYDWYTRYPGGHKVVSFETMQAKHPERIIELAVRRMLPKSKMGDKLAKKLKIYAGKDHPHQAQQPKALEL